MLRLKMRDISINPAYIEYVQICATGVLIFLATESGGITVDLKTVEDANCFAEYVELLVDISNTGATDTRREAVEAFELYFEDFLRPRAQYQAYQRVLKHLNERSSKS